MPYKSAILGCGPRADHHAASYEGLDEMRLDAACDLDRKRLDAFGAKHGVKRLYGDLDAMLKAERPDILHIVTPPKVREVPIEIAAKHGVRGVIVEKPMALVPSQAEKIRAAAKASGMKIAINTQRPYFATCQDLKRVLDEKRIGDIVFVRCVTRGNILSMGPHLVDQITFFLGSFADTAWACASGMNGYDYGHPAPANMLIRYTFPGGTVAYIEDAFDAVGVPGETSFWQHLELDFWGSQGRAWWTQNRDWGYQTKGMESAFTAKSRWDDDTPPGQREFTRAMAHWLDDDDRVHINCLDNALRQFDMVMGAMLSALNGEKVKLPVQVGDDVVSRLEQKLKK